MYYRRQPETPLPHDRTFIVNLADGTSLRINATSQMVTLHHHQRLHQEPIYRAVFFIADNPALGALYSRRFGWDIVGLISLMRSEIVTLTHLKLNRGDIRRLLDTDTVSVPSQQNDKQEKRSNRVGLQMILDFVLEHPNCTRLQIADGINRAKTPRVIAQIEYLVQLECLARLHAVNAKNTLEFQYIYLAPLPDNFD